MKSIGIMGGTFNPIHIGHLILAQEVREKMNLDNIIFIPAGNPPHKQINDIVGAAHRLEMVRLAVENNEKFYVSDIEIERVGKTYTYDTLIELHKMYFGNKIYFIIGYDTLKELNTWRKISEVCKLCSFIVVNRNNDYSEMNEEIEKKKSEYDAQIHVVNIPNIEISSTNIREKLLLNKSIKYIVPDNVLNYIYKNGLYRGE